MTTQQRAELPARTARADAEGEMRVAKTSSPTAAGHAARPAEAAVAQLATLAPRSAQARTTAGYQDLLSRAPSVAALRARSAQMHRGPAPRAPSAAPLQRKKIDIDGVTIAGSEAEDKAAFWTAFNTRFSDGAALVGLTKLIRVLRARWDAHEASDWDRAILGEAAVKLQAFQNAAGYEHQPALNDTQGEAIKKLLLDLGEDQEDDVPVEAVNADALTAIVKALTAYGKRMVKQLKRADKPKVKIGPGSAHGKILRRAVDAIMRKYGLKMQIAAAFRDGDDSVLGRLRGAELHHSTERWTEADATDKALAASAALQWTMGNEGAVTALITQAKQTHHRQSSVAAVQEAYADAIIEGAAEQPALQKALDVLAETRLRWGPITYGANIYLDVSSAAPDEDAQWYYLKTLIHEALHSAEHPSFTRFLDEELPEGLRSDIKEGIVEVLAQQVWADVVAEVARKDAPAANELPSGTAALTATAARLQKLRAPDGTYGRQVGVIGQIMKIIGGQAMARLEAAYLYGNVAAFLPRLNADPPSDDDGEGEHDGEGEDDDGSDRDQEERGKDEKKGGKDEKKGGKDEKKGGKDEKKGDRGSGSGSDDDDDDDGYADLEGARRETEAAFKQEQGGTLLPAPADVSSKKKLAEWLMKLHRMYQIRLRSAADYQRFGDAFNARYRNFNQFLAGTENSDEGRVAVYLQERAVIRANYLRLLDRRRGGLAIDVDVDANIIV